MDNNLGLMEPIDALAQTALEMWKLLRAFERTLAELGPEKVAKREAQLRYSKARLDSLLASAGIKFLIFDGQQFTANLPVSPVNADDIDEADQAIIETTLEPTIVGANVILHLGKVILAEDANVSRN